MVDQTRTSGQAVARTDGKFPDVSVAAGHKGFKAELDGLRDRMRSLGFHHDEIAAEIGRRDVGLRAGDVDDHAVAGGRLALFPGTAPTKAARTEVAGA
jgi:hypothetical protein